MLFIAHRGNTEGRNEARENEPNYIMKAMADGCAAEIDVWFYMGKFWLGHDVPTYEVGESFLEHPMLWCHAKNEAALWNMNLSDKINFFWHESDRFTLTSKGYVWTADTKTQLPNAVIMVAENAEPWQRTLWASNLVFGICSDVRP